MIDPNDQFYLSIAGGAGAGLVYALIYWRIVLLKRMRPWPVESASAIDRSRGPRAHVEVLQGLAITALALLLIIPPGKIFDHYYFHWYLSLFLFFCGFTLLPLVLVWRRRRGLNLIPPIVQTWRQSGRPGL